MAKWLSRWSLLEGIEETINALGCDQEGGTTESLSLLRDRLGALLGSSIEFGIDAAALLPPGMTALDDLGNTQALFRSFPVTLGLQGPALSRDLTPEQAIALGQKLGTVLPQALEVCAPGTQMEWKPLGFDDGVEWIFPEDPENTQDQADINQYLFEVLEQFFKAQFGEDEAEPVMSTHVAESGAAKKSIIHAREAVVDTAVEAADALEALVSHLYTTWDGTDYQKLSELDYRLHAAVDDIELGLESGAVPLAADYAPVTLLDPKTPSDALVAALKRWGDAARQSPPSSAAIADELNALGASGAFDFSASELLESIGSLYGDTVEGMDPAYAAFCVLSLAPLWASQGRSDKVADAIPEEVAEEPEKEDEKEDEIDADFEDDEKEEETDETTPERVVYQSAPIWPWVVGGLAVSSLVGFAAYKYAKGGE